MEAKSSEPTAGGNLVRANSTDSSATSSTSSKSSQDYSEEKNFAVATEKQDEDKNPFAKEDQETGKTATKNHLMEEEEGAELPSPKLADNRCQIFGYASGTIFVLLMLFFIIAITLYVSWYYFFAFIMSIVIPSVTIIAIISLMTIPQNVWRWLNPRRRCMTILLVASTGSFVASLAVLIPMVLDTHLDDSYYEIEDTGTNFLLSLSLLFFLPPLVVILPEIRESEEEIHRTTCNFICDTLVGFSNAVLLYFIIAITMPGFGLWPLLILIPTIAIFAVPKSKLPWLSSTIRAKISLGLNIFLLVILLSVYFTMSWDIEHGIVDPWYNVGVIPYRVDDDYYSSDSVSDYSSVEESTKKLTQIITNSSTPLHFGNSSSYEAEILKKFTENFHTAIKYNWSEEQTLQHFVLVYIAYLWHANGSTPSYSVDSLPYELPYHNPYANFCDWEGLSGKFHCDTDGSSKVTSLIARDSNVTGIIPEIIHLLPLKKLILTNEISQLKLSGTIPKSIVNMTNLEVLILSDNELSGLIPENLSNLKNLVHMDLSNNLLTGEISKSVCMMELTHLAVDCANKKNGTEPSVKCTCCTQCATTW